MRVSVVQDWSASFPLAMQSIRILLEASETLALQSVALSDEGREPYERFIR